MTKTALRLPFLLTLAAAAANAQAVVDYDTSTLANPPAFGYPLYTPGVGSLGQTVRVQWLCPAPFLGAQLPAPGFVTHIGLSLAGTATYDTFVLRAGSSAVASLTNVWDANLPDQRVQKDLSNVPLQGGGTAGAPVNQWVEFELDHPIHWQPGQGIVVDLTTHIAVAGQMLGTTIGTAIERAVHSNYQGGPTATTVQGSGGLVFRMRFAPLAIVPFGHGCPGLGGFTPSIGSSGQSALGSTSYQVTVSQVTPGVFGAFVVGFSRATFAGLPLPIAWGGGCDQFASADAVFGVAIGGGAVGGGSAALPLAFPSVPALAGTTLYAQFAQYDPASPATVPFVFSDAGAIVLH
jgi:hypothetical protein